MAPSSEHSSQTTHEPSGATNGRPAARRHSRFRIGAFRAIERCAAVLGGRQFYTRRFLRQPRLVVRHEAVQCPAGAESLAGLKIAHLSDLHAGPFVAAGALVDVERAVRAADPDLVCWTGDMVVHGVDNLRPMLPELERIRGRLGTFAVFGNHDYKRRRETEVIDWLPEWTFLRNGHVVVEAPCGARLGIAGIEDLEEGRAIDFDAALPEPGSERPVVDAWIALSHSPMGAPEFTKRGAAVVLSGHSHGTQVDLPWLRNLGPPHPGLRVELGRTTLIVSRGLGPIGVPLRFRAPAEVVIIELVARKMQGCKAVSGSTQAFSTSAATR